MKRRGRYTSTAQDELIAAILQRRREIRDELQAGTGLAPMKFLLTGIDMGAPEGDVSAVAKFRHGRLVEVEVLHAKEPAPRATARIEAMSDEAQKLALDLHNRGIARRNAAARKKVAEIRDNRRTKEAPVPTGRFARDVKNAAPRSIHQHMVVEYVNREQSGAILKSGANNAKLGGNVLVGRLRGAKIYAVTLEERATCPSDCALWGPCFGNGSQRAVRFKDTPQMRRALEHEVYEACLDGDPVLIRLHVLGDFPDAEYVELWCRMLARHPNLNVFGFTAHRPDAALGAVIARARDDFGLRFAIRHSDTQGRWGSTVVQEPLEVPYIERGGLRAIVCPEQRTAMNGQGVADHCGACGLCWRGAAEIIFIAH